MAETRSVAEASSMSMRTLFNIERAGRIQYGVRKQGAFGPGTVQKLVDYYADRGVTFLQASQAGAGIRFRDDSSDP